MSLLLALTGGTPPPPPPPAVENAIGGLLWRRKRTEPTKAPEPVVQEPVREAEKGQRPSYSIAAERAAIESLTAQIARARAEQEQARRAMERATTEQRVIAEALLSAAIEQERAAQAAILEIDILFVASILAAH